MQQGDYAGWRYSKLDQINTDNVKDIKVAWQFSTGVLRGHEGSPIVVGNRMYVHSAFPNNVFALDLDNENKILWKYSPKQDPSVIPVMCCDTVNRGVQVAGDTVILGQADTTLVALDAATGKEKWKAVNGDPKKGETHTGFVIIINDKVIMGTSGAEFGVRCHVTAYNLKDGKRAWRAYSMGPDSDILVDPRRPCRSASRSARTARSRPGRATSGRSVAVRPGAMPLRSGSQPLLLRHGQPFDLEPGSARWT